LSGQRSLKQRCPCFRAVRLIRSQVPRGLRQNKFRGRGAQGYIDNSLFRCLLDPLQLFAKLEATQPH
jgi:hypothetical protein